MARFIVAIFTVGIFISACTPGRSADDPEVIATTTVLADLVRNVAGDRLVVGSIAPAGAHVEEYEPRPDDARRVSGARVIFVNGLGLDSWADPLLRNAPAEARVVVLSDGLARLRDDHEEDEDHDEDEDEDKDEHAEGNPHYWLDVAHAKAYVERIREVLVQLDPDGRAGYEERTRAYLATLNALDREIREKVAKIPAERRKLVTSHHAFPFFAAAYGFEIVGFTQTAEGQEPSAGDLAALVERVRAARVPAVFVEEGVSPRVADALAREAGVKRVVDGLPTDSLTDDARSYVDLMRRIVDTIVDALR